MKSKSARKRKRNARRVKTERRLSRRRAAARAKVRPIALASKDGMAVPVTNDGVLRSLLACSAEGLQVFMHSDDHIDYDTQPWKVLHHAVLEVIEDFDWRPSQPLHPLEKLAKAAV